MGRLLVFIAFIVAASAAWIRVTSFNPLEPRIEGPEVVVTHGEFQGRFWRGASFSGAWMLFGGLADEAKTGFGNAHIAAIDLAEASWLMQEYPDFHRCSSPGADHAKRMVKQMTLIAANGFVRRTLHQALEQHDAAVAAGGDRVCLELDAEDLELSGVLILANGRDVTTDLQKATAHTRFAYVSHAALVDCRAPR